MKRFSKLLPLTASLVLLASCGLFGNDGDTEDTSTVATTEIATSDTASTEDTSVDTADIQDTATDSTEFNEESLEYYVPRFEDHLYSFAGEGNEFASYMAYPQFRSGQSIQFSSNNGGTETVRVYEYSEDEIREVFVRPETYFRQNFIEQLDDLESDQPEEIILQAPLEVGHSWESPSGSVSEITSLDTLIDIPMGSFEAIEVTRTHEDSTTRLYYVQELGLIKSNFINPDDTLVTSEMESVEEQPETHMLQVYYPDEQALGLDTSEMELTFQTNDSTRHAIQEALQDIPDYAGDGLIASNVTINTLYWNQDGRAYIDFSKELIDEMNAGAGVEGLILQAIVNTIGDYYGVSEVYLTVEQEPYESGHILMEEGQFMTVDYEPVND